MMCFHLLIRWFGCRIRLHLCQVTSLANYRMHSLTQMNPLPGSDILAVVSLRLDDVAHRLKNRRILLDVDGASKDMLEQHKYSEFDCGRAIARVVRTDVLFWKAVVYSH